MVENNHKYIKQDVKALKLEIMKSLSIKNKDSKALMEEQRLKWEEIRLKKQFLVLMA